MEYREIVAVTGLGGLFQLMATKSDGAIVRNLADQSTKFISARLHNVTPLESIEVYTTGSNVRLHEVFKKMKEHEPTIPLADHKKDDTKTIKHYFKSIFPEFDEERVYISDMKKMLKWYDLLKENNLLDKLTISENEVAAGNNDETVTSKETEEKENEEELHERIITEQEKINEIEEEGKELSSSEAQGRPTVKTPTKKATPAKPKTAKKKTKEEDIKRGNEE